MKIKKEEMLEIVKELRAVIVKHNLSPKYARSVADMLTRDIERTIEKQKKMYEEEGLFK